MFKKLSIALCALLLIIFIVGVNQPGQTSVINQGQARDSPVASTVRSTDAPKTELTWYDGRGGDGILVAILDTGIDQSHEDLAGQVVFEIGLTDSGTTNDVYGHGTHVAGIIAANDNDIGITGIAPESQLLNVKATRDNGLTCPSKIAKGIIWAVDKGASVINISVQLSDSSPELQKAVDYAWEKGAIVIAPAGNLFPMPVYPACLENCLAVAATTPEGNIASWSNYGDWVDVTALGVDIYSTLPGNSYGCRSGTSFATAQISGLAALLFNMVTDTNNNGRLNDEVWEAIVSVGNQNY